MAINECIICFENCENEYVYELFECNHKDNMRHKMYLRIGQMSTL